LGQLGTGLNNAPRFGIFGGSFDPVHNAHVALARVALAELRLDELLWVPAGQPWQKQRHLTPAADREAMVRLAIEGESRFTLSRIELERSGASYTIDTVRALQAARPGAQWFLVIGQDQYAGFHTWHGWRELLSLVTLAIADRPDAQHAVDPQVASAAHAAVSLPMMDVSSTDIRERVMHGQGILDLVPAAVARYIARHDLYRDQEPIRE
jgi:nicotinate-nucleotide adenylyltransferase